MSGVDTIQLEKKPAVPVTPSLCSDSDLYDLLRFNRAGTPVYSDKDLLRITEEYLMAKLAAEGG